NIGDNGSNLTITCLSLNRISLTEKLIQSVLKCIPNYKGKFLIIDNGSSPSELEQLSEMVKQIPLDIKLVELDKNYGVSGGRNKTLEHVETEWVMFLDNDIFFINNPLPRLQNDISKLGCHFINMPLLDPDGETLFARGGNIFVSIEDSSIHIGAGSACVQEKVSQYDTESFLSTFLFGGASVMNLNTLKTMGGYDENMFIGFEDIDLSIRLFQAGMKVGTCGAISLIHDHPKPSSDDDIAYERTRFTRNILKKSADYLEHKYGMIFWSAPVDDWLEQKHSTLNVGAKEEAVEVKKQLINKSTFSHAKPKVALIIDTENWAFSNIANQLVKNLSASYEFTIIPTEIVENISQLLMMTKDFDITHFFWRESLRLIQDPYYESYNLQLGYTKEQFYDAYLKERVITSSVYDHLFLSEVEIVARNDFYNTLVSAYTVSSSKLFDIYSSISSYPKP
ncbi:glycosyltransferase family 2 protein, partial [Kluyvera sp. Awk 3]|uniref:glycosyltransferase family 2 protein n=1 Tax=Kluyvera sp. Awk 3 TaxID=2963956 RepID=UPI002303FCD1